MCLDTLGHFEVKDKFFTCLVVHPTCKMVEVTLTLGTPYAPCQKITIQEQLVWLGIRGAFNISFNID